MNRLPLFSLAGVAFVLGSIGIVFYGVPSAWDATIGRWLESVSFVNYTLLALVMAGLALGLVWVGSQLIGANPPRGWRAGIALGGAGVILILLVTVWIGSILEYFIGADKAAMGLPFTIVVGAGMAYILVRNYLRPQFEQRLVAFEEQGWFSLVPYKKTQGQRVRRGTLLAVLAIAGCGIYTLNEHKTLEFGSPHWELPIPFTGGIKLLLLRDVRFTGPIILAFASLWLAYRVVNFPLFTDFLIATEAEINKVSWATRKRLVQDTIVVLTTVLLVTAFIFVADIIWGWSLQRVGVLQLPDKPTKQQTESPW